MCSKYKWEVTKVIFLVQNSGKSPNCIQSPKLFVESILHYFIQPNYNTCSWKCPVKTFERQKIVTPVNIQGFTSYAPLFDCLEMLRKHNNKTFVQFCSTIKKELPVRFCCSIKATCCHSSRLDTFLNQKLWTIFLFLHVNICCGYLIEVPYVKVLLMNTHNTCFHAEIRKICT